MITMGAIVGLCLVPQQLRSEGLLGGGGAPAAVECLTPAEHAEARARVEAYRRDRSPDLDLPESGVPERYTFYPLAGQLYRDIFTNNFVDLDPSAGILDWDCTNFSYDGHDATDVDLRTFGEQLIGVPVFAALDGVVIATHDGEDDMHTACSGTANSVIIDHGAGRVAYYWHLRKNSVLVAPSQVVKAGQPLGLAASSGCSTGPHLHFATYDDGNLVEPYTGPCNPGLSQWTHQRPIERSLYVRDLNLTNANIASYPGLPVDMPRRGTFVQGNRPVRFWTNLINLPAGSTWRVVYQRPDGSVALNSGTTGFGNPFYRWSWWWWAYTVNLNVTGTWHLRLILNGTLAAAAPFDVVATAGEIVNRPPDPVTVTLHPAIPLATDVLRCLVHTDLVLDDPDYDIVRYHYVWRVDGSIVRDVTSAAQTDVLARDTAPAGSWVTCEVTPSDGLVDAPSAVVGNFIQPYYRVLPRGLPVGAPVVEFP